MRPNSNINYDFGHVMWEALSHFESLIIEQKIKVIFNRKIQAIASFTYFYRAVFPILFASRSTFQDRNSVAAKILTLIDSSKTLNMKDHFNLCKTTLKFQIATLTCSVHGTLRYSWYSKLLSATYGTYMYTEIKTANYSKLKQ
jgi:hypothetical protein